MSENNEAPPKRIMLTQEQAAAVVYRDLKDNQRATFAVAADYGRWLGASLVLINAGALWGLFSYLGSVGLKSEHLSQFAAPIWSLIIGIVLAMASGFAAWLNWSMHSYNYQCMARHDMLWDAEQWVGDPHHRVGLAITHGASIMCGVLSLIAAVIAGAFILHRDFFPI